MQFKKKDIEISIPSMDSDEIHMMDSSIAQSCGIVSEIQRKDLNSKEKNEIIELALDEEGGIEKGIESLTKANLLINDFKSLTELLVGEMKKNLSKVSKKIITINPEKKEELKEEIIASQCMKIPNLNENQVKQLEEWTGLSCSEIVFDTNVDDWSPHTTDFNERIIGKKQLVFVIEDEDGEIFGYYCNTQIFEEDDWQQTDNKTFHFNLQSKNNRLEQPMKFEIIDLKKG